MRFFLFIFILILAGGCAGSVNMPDGRIFVWQVVTPTWAPTLTPSPTATNTPTRTPTITPSPTPRATDDPTPTREVDTDQPRFLCAKVIARPRLNLRNTPDISDNIIGSLRYEQVVWVDSNQVNVNGWSAVTVSKSGIRGYAWHKWLEMLPEVTC